MQYRCQCILADTLAFARGTSSFTNNDDYITAAMQPWVHSGWTSHRQRASTANSCCSVHAPDFPGTRRASATCVTGGGGQP